MVNNSTLRERVAKLSLKHAIIAMFALLVIPGFEVKAQDADLPEINFYYPWKMDDSPVELKPTMQANIFFKNGALVNSVKAAIEQDGAQIGTCLYVSKNGASATVTMDQSAAENADMLKIPAGNFTLKFYEINYVADGVEKTYSDINNPIDAVTYLRNKAEGTIVSASGLENKTIKSYYDPNGTDGVRTYKFGCPIDKSRIKVYFDYGMGNTYVLTALPWSVNEDQTELTIDLRGKCYNVDVIAPGVVFLDDNGNPCPPPTIISISVENLYGLDGSRIATTYTSIDGMYSTKLSGRLYENYHYVDLTFSTPELLRAEYYDSTNPKVRYNSINEQTDMMELYISNLSAISKANVKLSTPTVREVVNYEAITVKSGSYVISLPESIKAAGSDNLVISLANVEFAANDGAEHIINSLGGTEVEPDILTIAELKEVEPGTEVVLNSVDGLKVTLSNEAGYTFVEDNTGGLQIVTEDYSKVLNQGTLLQGRISGTYLGGNMFMIDINNCDYTESDVDVTKGTVIETITDLTSDRYHDCLVTIVANEIFEIVYDENFGYIVINEYLPVITDLLDTFEVTETINNVTGILFSDPNLNQSMLILRSADDININLGGTDSIISIASDGNVAADVYDMRGIKVVEKGNNIKGLTPGIYIINGKKALIK